MKIDNKNVNISNEFFFTSKGTHTIEVFLKNELNSMEKLFQGCSNLTEIDISQIEAKNISTMAEMFYDCAK